MIIFALATCIIFGIIYSFYPNLLNYQPKSVPKHPVYLKNLPVYFRLIMGFQFGLVVIFVRVLDKHIKERFMKNNYKKY